jgi:HSP20 family protein
MALFQWGQGWEPFGDLERHVEQMLATMRQSLPTLRVHRAYPPLNLAELEQEYLLTAKVPGMSPAQLDLTVSEGMLTLRGDRGRPEGVRDDEFRRHERYWGRWERSVALPERVVLDRITAEVSDGLLVVHLPKAIESRARQIVVATGEAPSSQSPSQSLELSAERAEGQAERGLPNQPAGGLDR